jgi:hypothetical protein
MTANATEGDAAPRARRRQRLRLERVAHQGAPDGNCLISVILESRGRLIQGEARALDTHHGRVRASAEAALAAALSAGEGRVQLELIGVKAFRAFDGWVVVVRVVARAGEQGFRLLGASSSEDEAGVERASAQAVLDATNRVLERYALA